MHPESLPRQRERNILIAIPTDGFRQYDIVLSPGRR